MKKQIQRYFLGWVMICLCVFGLKAQTGNIIGINRNKELVRINLENANVSLMAPIKDLPSNARLHGLVFIPADTAFYTIMNPTSNPSLVKIWTNGWWKDIGPITFAGQPIQLCESITYDEASNRLLVSVSANGGIQWNDYASETLMEVSRSDGRCTRIASLKEGFLPDDFDRIAVFGTQLFGMDGRPDKNTTYIFPFILSEMSGEMYVGTKQNIPYFTMDDVMVIGQFLYFTHKETNALYYYDMLARKWSQVAPFKGDETLPGGVNITGMAYLPLPQV
ncbi:MAG: hypothetical protein R2795_07155 [Saprospiraceae bacterium]